MGKKELREKIIPPRAVLAMILIIIQIIIPVAVMVLFTIYLPYFWIAELLLQIGCAIAIASSEHNPDYKVPWLFVVTTLPVIGFMIYFIFFSRKLRKRRIRELKKLSKVIDKDDDKELQALKEYDRIFASFAEMLKKTASTHVYRNTKVDYFCSGEELFARMAEDISAAEKFVFLEFFIIQEGKLWDNILRILKSKVEKGVEVRVIYDDVGSLKRLPGNYYKKLNAMGIKTVIFSKLKGRANNEFNNRNHRKIAVIDGKTAYTGGINLADEYANYSHPFGHFKDVGVRLEGEAVNEFTRLFYIDYEGNLKVPNYGSKKYYTDHSVKNDGFCIPFGDGPKPMYKYQVGKTVIMNMLTSATDYVYITTPYLIIDNELCQAVENAAIRGVDVKIITPRIPDKKMVFTVTRSFYDRFISAGVKIYEYTPGFIHAKTYLSDDKMAMVGTLNLDYRSLVHHFENGVLLINDKVIADIKKDFEDTLKKSEAVDASKLKKRYTAKFTHDLVKIFSPLL